MKVNDKLHKFWCILQTASWGGKVLAWLTDALLLPFYLLGYVPGFLLGAAIACGQAIYVGFVEGYQRGHLTKIDLNQ